MKHFCFLLLPDYSNLCLFNALEPLRAANSFLGHTYYSWSLVTLDGNPVDSSSGMALPIDGTLKDGAKAGASNILVLQASYNYQRHSHDGAVKSLRLYHSLFETLGGFDAGSYLLAKAGLLDGYSATIHWAELEVFAEKFHEVTVSDHRYVIDRNRITAGGATTALDLMIALIRKDHGAEIAMHVANLFIFDMERHHNTPQKQKLSASIEDHAPRIARAIHLMDQHIEHPLTIPELARQSGLSQRQLERQFLNIMESTVKGFYLKIRLLHAQHLLCETSLSVTEIGLRSGFKSRTSFSKRYSDHFGKPPSAERG